MYSVILTELGIAVFENEKCLKSFPFTKTVEDYVFVKKGESRLSELAKFLSNVEKGIEVNDGFRVRCQLKRETLFSRKINPMTICKLIGIEQRIGQGQYPK